MAARYWVRNAVGNWNNTANWSTSSTAVTGGASVPGTADTVFFNANAQAGNCTVDISPTVISVNMSGYTGTLTFNSAGNFITITGTGTVFTGSTSATIVRTGASITGDNIVTAGTTTAAKTITTGSVTEANAINFNIQSSSTGTYALGTGVFGNLIASANITLSSVTVYGNFSQSTYAAPTGTVTMAPDLSVAATAMVAGTKYTIKTTGTTNFTSYGATENTPNTIFTATGAGTGNGTVTPTKLFFGYNTSGTSLVVNIGDLTSQGSVALANNISFSNALNIQSGFFNNQGYLLTSSSTNGVFDYSAPYTKNIKITRSIYNYDLSLIGTNTFRGLTPNGGNRIVDFSKAIIVFGGGAGSFNFAIPSDTVFNEVRLESLTSSTTNFSFTGTNFTIYTLNLINHYGNAGTTHNLSFDAGATVNVGNILNTVNISVPSNNVISSSVSGSPFTLNKIGGGCGYFVGRTIKDCTGTPTNAWVASTSTSTAQNNGYYFGTNVNGGGNSGIVFNQFPALGGFNVFF